MRLPSRPPKQEPKYFSGIGVRTCTWMYDLEEKEASCPAWLAGLGIPESGFACC